MDLLGGAQNGVLILIGLAALAMEIFALVDAVRHRPDAYVAASKRTKNFWMLVLGVSVLIGFVTALNVIGSIIGLLPIVAAGVYLADVRPALRQVSGKGGGSTHQGPYGPW